MVAGIGSCLLQCHVTVLNTGYIVNSDFQLFTGRNRNRNRIGIGISSFPDGKAGLPFCRNIVFSVLAPDSYSTDIIGAFSVNVGKTHSYCPTGYLGSYFENNRFLFALQHALCKRRCCGLTPYGCPIHFFYLCFPLE